MLPIREKQSWVLSTALVIIPILLLVLALWLWPQMRHVYRLPDSAVSTYQKALDHAVPPGSGRVTRTAVIEQALAETLGQLSDAAALPDSQQSAPLQDMLRYNAQVGRWAGAVMTFPRSGRVALFNWGLRSANLPIVNHVFSRWSFHRLAALRALVKMPGPFADAMIMRLLHDPVFVVRLAVMAALYNRRPTVAEMALLRQWAAEKNLGGLAKLRRWKMFLFGREAVNATPVLYRMNRQSNLIDTRQFAAALLARWSLPTPLPAKADTEPVESPAASMPAAIVHGRATADRAGPKVGMKSVRKAMTELGRVGALAKRVKATLAAQYRTLITIATAMPWQKQLSHIMAFNAAMSRWIYLIAQLPPQQRQALFNWARSRTQDVELIRLVMSQNPGQRLRAAAVAPKLHGTQRVWLVQRLLTDQSVTVELTMLHELWTLHPSTQLRKMLIHWTNLEPLPKGHSPQVIIFNGKKYTVNRTITLSRYRTARRIGALLLQRWKKPTP